MSGKLFVVGTPIGNLEDMSPRGIATLENADFIAAEDTRVTLKLLNRFGIKKELISYYEHSKSSKENFILNRIAAGENCALVSDAGMPAISDPGEELVRKAREMNIETLVVPGPSAVISALAISGMPTGRFCFEGFLTMNKPGRRKHLAELVNEKRTMVFYEAPHKLVNTLKDMLETFGERDIALVKELTKIHETVLRTTFSEALTLYEQEPPRGEFVIIVAGAKEKEQVFTLEDAVDLAKELMLKGESASAAARTAAKETGIKKGDIYKEISEQNKNENDL